MLVFAGPGGSARSIAQTGAVMSVPYAVLLNMLPKSPPSERAGDAGHELLAPPSIARIGACQSARKPSSYSKSWYATSYPAAASRSWTYSAESS